MPVREIILIIGLMLVIYAWSQALNRKGRTRGTVIKMEYSTGRVTGGRKGWRPVIAFEVDRKEYTFTPSVVTVLDTRAKNVGASVPVAYNPANPQDAELAVPWRMYASPALLTLLYAVFAYFSFG